ncbi:DUF6286 domain-containing protein [Prauserella muralis]|uniref:DUF6286 domain-containing protein n=1 Tax=Prauserella muralis TaxID=588067 RepID=A0A2V4B2C4_9PSEU|nr:DUF6286 domain-containing protein [Prauserella muralis]PXY28203.1 hypothetical protein BAY60_17915 [Prauserella muralis]TWE21981.1 hypothetical protein FHX69_3213 [Prauserella muralis]
MRVFVRLLSTVLALALAAAGALLALEVAWHWWRPAGAPLLLPWPGWRDTLGGLAWDSPPLRVAAIVTGGAGLVLLLAAGAARRREVPLREPAAGVRVTTSPRALARLVGQHVRAQDNVTGATVTAGSRKVRVRATSTLEAEQQLRPRLTESVTALLDDVPLVRRPTVSVVVDSPKDRR